MKDTNPGGRPSPGSARLLPGVTGMMGLDRALIREAVTANRHRSIELPFSLFSFALRTASIQITLIGQGLPLVVKIPSSL